MSRLDRHVAAVQNKLALTRFIESLALTAAIAAGAVLATILTYKLFQIAPPRPLYWLLGAVGTAGLAALVMALIRRPSSHDAAVAIDQHLGLKEKFSTALLIRPSSDPFAKAAVRDAEATAERVALDFYKHFPMAFPKPAMVAIGLALAAVLSWYFLPSFDLFGREAAVKKSASEVQKQDAARKSVERALATVNAVPKALADDESVKLAKKDLEQILKQPIADPEKAHRSALKALQDVTQAAKAQIKSNQKFADAQNDTKMFKNLMPPSDETGPVSDAQRALAKGDFNNAMQKLDEAVKKFDQMSDEEKKKAADQMASMAKQLQQMANDPQKQQQMQQQMQQMGMNQQQAQQAQQLMQQAAQGNQQAQQQLQQMAKQAMQQMNNGQGPTAQQQQQIQQMMQQAQAQANAQQQAQNMQQGAQQMAQAMQQDAQQVAAAQQAAQNAADQQANAMNGQNPGGQQPGQNQAGNGKGQGNQGQWQQGDPNKPGGNGGGGPAQGTGKRDIADSAPYGIKQEVSPSQDKEDGQVLASTLVKADSVKGESKQQLKEVVTAAQQEQTDEVDEERISRQAREVVKGYFGSMEKDTK